MRLQRFTWLLAAVLALSLFSGYHTPPKFKAEIQPYSRGCFGDSDTVEITVPASTMLYFDSEGESFVSEGFSYTDSTFINECPCVQYYTVLMSSEIETSTPNVEVHFGFVDSAGVLYEKLSTGQELKTADTDYQISFNSTFEFPLNQHIKPVLWHDNGSSVDFTLKHYHFSVGPFGQYGKFTQVSP